MARLGLQARDSLSLASTKFKSRKIRTALTLITAAVLAFILVVCSGLLSGFLRAAEATPQSALADLHLARFTTIDKAGRSGNASIDAAKELTTNAPSAAKIREVYFEKNDSQGGSYELDLVKPQQSNTPDSLSAMYPTTARWVSEELFKPYLRGNHNTAWKPGDPLPVLVTNNVVEAAHATELAGAISAKERIGIRERHQKELLGKVGTLTRTSISFGSAEGAKEGNAGEGGLPPEARVPAPQNLGQPTQNQLKVKVVGFNQGPSFLSYEDSGFTFPYETTREHPELTKFLDSVNATYPSFETAAQRDAFAEANKANGASIYADPIAQNKDFFSGFINAFRIATIVMLVLMAIPMATTISKLLSDSQRETGVFRAIGARNRHIIAIYGLYGLFIAIGAFILATICGVLVGLLLTAKFGGSVSVGFATALGATVDVNFAQPKLSQLLTIFGGLVGGVIVGSLFPLFRALKRDPIKSLRDE